MLLPIHPLEDTEEWMLFYKTKKCSQRKGPSEAEQRSHEENLPGDFRGGQYRQVRR